MDSERIQLEWLFDNAGTIIRYLIAKHHRDYQSRLDELRREMLQDDHVQYWIDQFEEVSRRRRVHDSFDYCFENAMGKIVRYEVRNDRIMAVENELLELVKRTLLAGERVFKYHLFDAGIVVAYFVQAGIHENEIVGEFVRDRIERVHDCIKTYGYDIYTDKTLYKGIPKAFRDQPLVEPEIANADYSHLPTVWDIEIFHSVYDSSYSFDEEHRTKVETILSYIMDDAYQMLPHGYGIQRSRPGAYHGIGWSVHLPDIDNLGVQLPTDLLYFAHLLSNYPTLIRSDWFRQAMAILQGYEVESGRFRFPKEIIQEKKNHYFTGGGHMGWGENRREKETYTVESTFWMWRIYRLLEITQSGSMTSVPAGLAPHPKV